MKVIVYARVSTADQEDRGTIAMQHDQLGRWAAANSAEIVQTYQDEDASGTLMLEERPGGAQLLAELAAHKSEGVTHVVFYEWSRLARDPCVFWDAVHKIERRAGFALRSITEREETSDPDGVLLLCIRNGINYTERIRTIRRSIDATEMLVRQGVWVGGAAPYGYLIQGSRREARIVPANDPIPGLEHSEADVVRLIFRWCIEDHLSTQAIADRLNDLGIPPAMSRPGKTPKRQVSGRWTNARVGKLIATRTYSGTHVWGARSLGMRTGPPIERSCPSLVDVRVWERAQQVIRENALWSDRNVKREYLLRGLMKCGACGCSYVGSANTTGGGEVGFYKCAGGPRHRRGCRNRIVPAGVEDRVWAHIVFFAGNPGAVLEELAESGVGPEVTAATELQVAEQQRAQLTRQRDRILELLRRETIDFETADAQLSALRTEERRCAKRAEEMAAVVQREEDRQQAVEGISGILDTLRTRLDVGLDFAARRGVIETLVEGIVVVPVLDRDCVRVEVTYRFPARMGAITLDWTPQGCPCGDQSSLTRQHCHCGRGRGARWEA